MELKKGGGLQSWWQFSVGSSLRVTSLTLYIVISLTVHVKILIGAAFNSFVEMHAVS